MEFNVDTLVEAKDDLINNLEELDYNFFKNLMEIIFLIESTLKNNNTVFWCGNGGSASQADHFSAEFVGRFKTNNREPLRSISLSSNTSIITAIANDFGYEEIFSRQLFALAKKEDLLILISTSGNSKNILNAIDSAKKIGVKTIAFFGINGAKVANKCDHSINIKSTNTARIQEMQIFIGHIICQLIDEKFSYGEKV